MMPRSRSRCIRMAVVLSVSTLLLLKFVEGWNVAVRPFRVFRVTLTVADVKMTDHAARSTSARML